MHYYEAETIDPELFGEDQGCSQRTVSLLSVVQGKCRLTHGDGGQKWVLTGGELL